MQKEFFLWNNVECTLSNQDTSIYKELYTFFHDTPFHKQQILQALLSYCTPKQAWTIESIFDLFKWKENSFHIWFDSKNDTVKFYISLYHTSFQDSLRIISDIKKILWIKKDYFLELDFLAFDCLWMNVSKEGLHLKIYEIIKKENHYGNIPNFIRKQDIKEAWYLKDFFWRKKQFFRLWKHYNIQLFSELFDTSIIQSFWENIKDFYILQNKVKYYCHEGEKREIYFI